MIKAEDGGTIKIQNGVELVIKPNALKEDTKISAVMSSRQIEQGIGRKQLVFRFEPSGTTFDPPAELHIDRKFFEEEDADDIVVISEESGEEAKADVYEDANEIVIYIPHFSSYYYPRR